MTRTGRQHVKGGKRGGFDGVRPGALSFRLLAAVALSAAQASPQAKVLSKPVHLRDLVDEVERMIAA